MKEHKVSFSSEALEDIDNIWLFIANESKDVEIADKVEKDISDYCYDTLAYIPETGKNLDDILTIKGLRMSPVTSYRKYNIFHRLDNGVLQIVRVMRCSRNYSQQF